MQFISHTVYIIYSPKLDKYYIGYTKNVLLRLEQHNSAISTFTAKASDWQLKYSEVFPIRETAIRRDKDIKNKKCRKYIEWLVNSAR